MATDISTLNASHLSTYFVDKLTSAADTPAAQLAQGTQDSVDRFLSASEGSRFLLLKQNIDAQSIIYSAVELQASVLADLDNLINDVLNLETNLQEVSLSEAARLDIALTIDQRKAAINEVIAQSYHRADLNLSGFHGATDKPLTGLLPDTVSVESLGVDQAELLALEVDFAAIFENMHFAPECPVCSAQNLDTGQAALSASLGDDIASSEAIASTYTTNNTGTASSGSFATNYIEALNAGVKWDIDTAAGETLTYSFYKGDAVTPYAYNLSASYNDNTPVPLSNGDAGNDQKVRDAFAKWDAVIGINLEEVTETAGSDVVGEMRVAFVTDRDGGGAGTFAFAYYPNSGASGGDVWFDMADTTVMAGEYTFDYFATIHEMGHAIGLAHPFAGASPFVAKPELAGTEHYSRNTVMSYNFDDRNGYFDVSTLASGYSYSNWKHVYPVTPMIYDIAYGEELYGAETTTNTGSTSYSFAVNPVTLETIYDSGGEDTLDASNQTRQNIIDLTPGSFSSIGLLADRAAAQAYYEGLGISSSAVSGWFGVFDATASSMMTANTGDFTDGVYRGQDNVAIAFSTTIEHAKGGSGNDQITGNDAANRLEGNAGDDEISGGRGNDIIDGGSGSDTAVFAGNASAYRVKREGSSVTVTDLTSGRYGTDSLLNVEYIRFDDQTLTVATLDDETVTISAENRVGDRRRLNQAITSYRGGARNDTLIADRGDRTARTIDGGAGHDIIVSGAGADVVQGGAGDDTLRGGAGRDVLDGGSGNDRFVIVGQTRPGQYAASAIANSAGSGVNLAQSLSLDDLNNNRESDLEAGEVIRGGEGYDAIFGYGDMDFTTVDIDSVEEINLNSYLRIRADQLAALASVGGRIQGDGTSVIEIVAAPGQNIVDLQALTLSGIGEVKLAAGVAARFGDASAAGVAMISGRGEVAATSERGQQKIAAALLRAGSTNEVAFHANDRDLGRYRGFVLERARASQQLQRLEGPLLTAYEDGVMRDLKPGDRLQIGTSILLTERLARGLAERAITLEGQSASLVTIAAGRSVVDIAGLSFKNIAALRLDAGARVVLSGQQLAPLQAIDGAGTLASATPDAFEALRAGLSQLRVSGAVALLESKRDAELLTAFKLDRNRLSVRAENAPNDYADWTIVKNTEGVTNLSGARSLLNVSALAQRAAALTETLFMSMDASSVKTEQIQYFNMNATALDANPSQSVLPQLIAELGVVTNSVAGTHNLSADSLAVLLETL